ncbi:hypothetical protein Fmac_000386 [Flemingia macrophylla]|uniref:Patatin n=1 Tax=Flemingia macrophylla TaxID=520843 RepID=A0ABD1NE87_9FABA
MNTCSGLWEYARKFVRLLLGGPKYDGKNLEGLVREKLGETRLHETLTNIVIPTIDIKELKPKIFSSYRIKKSPCLDARLSDICMGTSAAPTHLPVYHFKNQNPHGNIHEFNLVDGGVCANNPSLTGNNSSVDIATKENLEKLSQIGERLPKKPVSQISLVTDPLNRGKMGRPIKMLPQVLPLKVEQVPDLPLEGGDDVLDSGAGGELEYDRLYRPNSKPVRMPLFLFDQPDAPKPLPSNVVFLFGLDNHVVPPPLTTHLPSPLSISTIPSPTVPLRSRSQSQRPSTPTLGDAPLANCPD